MRGQKKPRRPSPLVRGTTCTCRCGTDCDTTLLTATNEPCAPRPGHHGPGHPLGRAHQHGQQLGGQVDEGVDVDLGHQQDVALEDRPGVEEAQRERLVEHDGRRQRAVDDPAEQTVHGPTLAPRTRADAGRWLPRAVRGSHRSGVAWGRLSVLVSGRANRRHAARTDPRRRRPALVLALLVLVLLVVVLVRVVATGRVGRRGVLGAVVDLATAVDVGVLVVAADTVVVVGRGDRVGRVRRVVPRRRPRLLALVVGRPRSSAWLGLGLRWTPCVVVVSLGSSCWTWAGSRSWPPPVAATATPPRAARARAAPTATATRPARRMGKADNGHEIAP